MRRPPRSRRARHPRRSHPSRRSNPAMHEIRCRASRSFADAEATEDAVEQVGIDALTRDLTDRFETLAQLDRHDLSRRALAADLARPLQRRARPLERIDVAWIAHRLLERRR